MFTKVATCLQKLTSGDNFCTPTEVHFRTHTKVMPPMEVTPPTEVTKSLISYYESHFHLQKSFSTTKVDNYNHGSHTYGSHHNYKS